mmetsp:Transcript_128748/g.223290  ORF Transcript_128748/g.223290 Transcript_128748/m.223290 type:complete len:80 (-) Transcript_128748:27-266(-)
MSTEMKTLSGSSRPSEAAVPRQADALPRRRACLVERSMAMHSALCAAEGGVQRDVQQGVRRFWSFCRRDTSYSASTCFQ